MIEKTKSQDLAIAQYQEKFDEPDVRKKRMLDQLEKDLKAIDAEITEDPCTNGIPTLRATTAAFEKMRDNLCNENLPGITLKKGEFFPLEMMQKIYKVYCKRWVGDASWNAERLRCYLKFVIGYAPRFFAADDLLRLLRGLENKSDDQVPLYGDFKQKFIFNNQILDLDFTQPDKFDDFRLGFDFFVDVYFGDVTDGAGALWLRDSVLLSLICLEY